MPLHLPGAHGAVVTLFKAVSIRPTKNSDLMGFVASCAAAWLLVLPRECIGCVGVSGGQQDVIDSC